MNDLTTLGNQMPGVNSEGRDVAVFAESSREQAHVMAAFTMAYKKPRIEGNVIEKLNTSCCRYGFAEKVTYSFPRGKSMVTGGSIYLAREVARLWGNNEHGFEIVQDDEETRTVRGYAIDYETNTRTKSDASFKKLIQRKNKDGETYWVVPDERDLRELTNKHGAIAKRNAIFELIPKDIVDGAIAQAKKTVAKGYKEGAFDPVALIKSFKTIGVSSAMIEEYCGCGVSAITPEQYAELRGIFAAIKDGTAEKEEYFGADEAKTEMLMPQETKNVTPKKKPAPASSISGMKKAAKVAGIPESELTEFCKEQFNINSLDEVSAEDLGKVSEWIEFNKPGTGEDTKEGELL